MNKIDKLLNIIFILCIPCYIWDLYNYIVIGERDTLIYIALVSLTLFFILDIPRRIDNYKKFKTIWY